MTLETASADERSDATAGNPRHHANSWVVLLLVFAMAGVVESQAFGHLNAFRPLYLQQLGVPAPNIPTWTGACWRRWASSSACRFFHSGESGPLTSNRVQTAPIPCHPPRGGFAVAPFQQLSHDGLHNLAGRRLGHRRQSLLPDETDATRIAHHLGGFAGIDRQCPCARRHVIAQR